MKQGGQIVLTTENLKVHLVGEEKEIMGCFPVILFFCEWSGNLSSSCPIPWLREHMKYAH